MTTKLGKVFLNILDKCFPVGHVLRRVFNRHTVQLSYRTMPNMASIIAANNRGCSRRCLATYPTNCLATRTAIAEGGPSTAPWTAPGALTTWSSTRPPWWRRARQTNSMCVTEPLWKKWYGGHKSNMKHSDH